MSKRIFYPVFALIALFLLVPQANGQGMGVGRKLGKIDQLEKLKLIEALNLSEENSVKFFTRYSAFKKKQRAQLGVIDSLGYELKKLTDSKADTRMLKKLIDEYLDAERALHNARVDFVGSVSDLLTTEQTAKLLVVERNFRKEMQEMIIGQGKKWRGSKNQE